MLLALVNKELTGLQLGRKKLVRRPKLSRNWKEGQSLRVDSQEQRK